MSENPEPWAMAPPLDPRDRAAQFPLVMMARCHRCGVCVPLGRAVCGGDTLHPVCGHIAEGRAS